MLCRPPGASWANGAGEVPTSDACGSDAFSTKQHILFGQITETFGWKNGLRWSQRRIEEAFLLCSEEARNAEAGNQS